MTNTIKRDVLGGSAVETQYHNTKIQELLFLHRTTQNILQQTAKWNGDLFSQTKILLL